jgi:hypothetical protein
MWVGLDEPQGVLKYKNVVLAQMGLAERRHRKMSLDQIARPSSR